MPPIAPAPRTTKRMRALCHGPPWQAFRVAAMHAFERAAALGESVAATPLRLVGGLAAPARGGMERSVRRAIGIRDERGVISRDPDEAFTPPDGVARRVHADLSSMLIGGVERAAAPDPAPAGHGRRGRPLGLPRRSARAAPPHRAIRGHHDLWHDGPGRRSGGPGAAGAPAGQGHLPRRPQVLGGRSGAGDLHPRGGGLELPGLLAALTGR